jgi:hypothetical protein
MQDCYAGDIGDFGKFALLRALAFDLRVGVIWYRTSGLKNNNDDKHPGYLCKPERFRNLDCHLFDRLKTFRDKFEKNPKLRWVKQLEKCQLLKNASYIAGVVPTNVHLRKGWTTEIMHGELAASDLLFLDPDNGIEGKQLTEKHAALDEITELRQMKIPLLIYHH